MSAPPRFTFDPASHRYRSLNTGRYLSASTVNGYMQDYSANVGKTLRDLTQQLREGALDLRSWQLQMAQEIKNAHLAAGMAASGGKAQMTQATFGAIGQQIRQEYQFLSRFADGIADGSIPMDGRILARAEQYGKAATETFWRVSDREMRRRGVDEVMNRRHATDSCPGCIEAESLGWVPLSQMSYPGTRECRANCRCELVYRVSATGQTFG